jgi:hypothetical protein
MHGTLGGGVAPPGMLFCVAAQIVAFVCCHGAVPASNHCKKNDMWQPMLCSHPPPFAVLLQDFRFCSVSWLTGLVDFRWLLFVLLNSSAEMCAGSLAGCWILGILATSSQVYGAHGMGWVSFGMLGLVPLSTLASWRILGRSCDDPGTVEVTGKDPVRSRLGFY